MEFDVRAWVANVLGVGRSEVDLTQEGDAENSRTATYSRHGKEVATIDVAAVRLGPRQRPAWHLVARIGGELRQLQLPTTTRFIWR